MLQFIPQLRGAGYPGIVGRDKTRAPCARGPRPYPKPEPTVEARKLEHQYPHGLKVKYRGSQHSSSKNHVPTFRGSL